jgi:hypothetical protein
MAEGDKGIPMLPAGKKLREGLKMLVFQGNV